MPIKKLTFSFDVPLTSLLSLIAAGQADMRIDVIGDDKPVPLSKLLASNGVAGLLEPPRASKRTTSRAVDASGKPTTSIAVILAAMASHPDHARSTTDLKPLIAEIGLMPNSVSPQVAMGQKKGWFERVDTGLYKLTAAGIAECERRGIEVFKPPTKTTAKPPKSPKVAAARAPVKSNGAAHHG